MLDSTYNAIQTLIQKPRGILLVTGPTALEKQPHCMQL